MLKKKLISVIIFTLISLVCIDLLLGITVTKFGFSPQPSAVYKYFSYGVSSLRKLKVLVGSSDDNAFSISKAGWNSTLPDRMESENADCEKKITLYGMSFSDRIAKALHEIDSCYLSRNVLGPGSPLSHSYYSFKNLNAADDSDVIGIAVLASALPKLFSVSHGSVAFEFPGGHLYPRYTLDAGELNYQKPPARSLKEFRELIKDKQGLQELKDFFNTNDAFYREIIFDYEWADYSVFLRLLRRAVAQNHVRSINTKVYDGQQFTDYKGFKQVALNLVIDFVERVREANKIPFVILLNDLNHAESLDPIFMPYLVENQVDYITSTDHIDSRNIKNFLGDGHYTAANDSVLAKALYAKLNQLAIW